MCVGVLSGYACFLARRCERDLSRDERCRSHVYSWDGDLTGSSTTVTRERNAAESFPVPVYRHFSSRVRFFLNSFC